MDNINQLDTVDIRSLRIFMSLLETHNISRSAELFGVSQPTVSRVVRRLEKAFGFRLFETDATGAIPTHRAKELGKYCERCRQEFTRFSKLNSPILTEAATIKIASCDLFALAIYPELTQYIDSFNPQLAVIYEPLPVALSALGSVKPKQLEKALSLGDYDLVLYHNKELFPGLKHQLVFEDEWVEVQGEFFDPSEDHFTFLPFMDLAQQIECKQAKALGTFDLLKHIIPSANTGYVPSVMLSESATSIDRKLLKRTGKPFKLYQFWDNARSQDRGLKDMRRTIKNTCQNLL